MVKEEVEMLLVFWSTFNLQLITQEKKKSTPKCWQSMGIS